MRQHTIDTSQDSEDLTSTHREKRTWKTKTAVAVGIGVPLGLIAMSNPAAASPEADYASDDLSDDFSDAFDSDLSDDTDAGGDPDEFEEDNEADSPAAQDQAADTEGHTGPSDTEDTTIGASQEVTGGQTGPDTSEATANKNTTQETGGSIADPGFDITAKPAEGPANHVEIASQNGPTDDEKAELQAARAELQELARTHQAKETQPAKEQTNTPAPREPATPQRSTEQDFRDLTKTNGDFNQPSLEPGGTRHDVPLRDGHNDNDGVVINGTNQADDVQVQKMRNTGLAPEVDEGFRKHLNVVSVNGNHHYVDNRKELRVNLHDGDDNYKVQSKKGVRDDAPTYVSGGKGDDTMAGGRGADIMDGGLGDDTMFGHRGNDVMSGGAGEDDMHGGLGDDKMFGGDGKDSMHGGTATWDKPMASLSYWFFGGNGNDNDYMDGGSGDDRMKGGYDDDKMFGGSGDDYMRGGKGNDDMFGGRGNDDMKGGRGNDNMYGDSGISPRQWSQLYAAMKKNTRVDFNERKTAITGKNFQGYVTWLSKQAANGGLSKLSDAEQADWRLLEPLISGDDTMDGGLGRDYVNGEGGDDVIRDTSPRTNDKLVGGAGQDTITAKYGPKVVYGQAGNDTIYTSQTNAKGYKNFGDEGWKYGLYETEVIPGSGADTVHLSWRAPAKVIGAEAHDSITSGPSMPQAVKDLGTSAGAGLSKAQAALAQAGEQSKAKSERIEVKQPSKKEPGNAGSVQVKPAATKPRTGKQDQTSILVF